MVFNHPETRFSLNKPSFKGKFEDENDVPMATSPFVEPVLDKINALVCLEIHESNFRMVRFGMKRNKQIRRLGAN